eukprot:COSAG04_NODE_15162_length_541_cov_1.402715_1_plen_84_part_00
MSKHEKDLWRAVVDSVDPGVAGYYDDRITYLCTRFREFEPISVRLPTHTHTHTFQLPLRNAFIRYRVLAGGDTAPVLRSGCDG